MHEREIFIEALRQEAPDARRAFLDQACGDSALRQRVEDLLAVLERAGSFLELPPTGVGVIGTRQTDDLGSRAGEEGPGSCIGLYKLLQEIGEGGMGAVFLAEQTRPVRGRRTPAPTTRPPWRPPRPWCSSTPSSRTTTRRCP